MVGAAPVLPAPRHTRARTHTFGRGKLRPDTERTPAKVTSGGGAGSGFGSVRPWTPRPAGPTRRGRALGGSARTRQLRAPRGRSRRAGRGPPLRGRAVRIPEGWWSRGGFARAPCGLEGSGDPAPPALQAGRCGAAPGTSGGRGRAATALCGQRSGVLGIRVGAGAFHANAVHLAVQGRTLGVALCPSPPFPTPLYHLEKSLLRFPVPSLRAQLGGRSISGICFSLLDAPGSG